MRSLNLFFVSILAAFLICGFASCKDDVYDNDGSVVIPERPVYPPITSSWKYKSAVADVNTGVSELDAALKQALENNELIVLLKAYKAAFKFNIYKKAILTALDQSFPAGTYEYDFQEDVLNYTLEIKGLSDAGIPDIGPVLIPLAIKMLENNTGFNATMNAKPLVYQTLKDKGFTDDQIAKMKIDLVFSLEK